MMGSQGRAEMRKRNFRSLVVKQCGRVTSDLVQSMLGGTAEAELQILGSQDKTEVREQNFRSLAVQSSWKYGSRTLYL